MGSLIRAVLDCPFLQTIGMWVDSLIPFSLKTKNRMAEKKPMVQQPGEDAERSLLEILADGKEVVEIRGNKYKIGTLHKGTMVKVSELVLEKESSNNEEDSTNQINEDKIQSKIAAAYILNSWWTLYFLGGIVWSIYWRWLYYIKEYTDVDYLPLMLLCKKKAQKQSAAYLHNTTLATDMKMTTMTMTRKEVNRIRVAHSMEQPGQQQ